MLMHLIVMTSRFNLQNMHVIVIGNPELIVVGDFLLAKLQRRQFFIYFVQLCIILLIELYYSF